MILIPGLIQIQSGGPDHKGLWGRFQLHSVFSEETGCLVFEGLLICCRWGAWDQSEVCSLWVLL